jgi:hypothetical protein
VFSKAEGGEWGLAHLPTGHHPVIRLALDNYASSTAEAPFDPAALAAFAQDMQARLG